MAGRRIDFGTRSGPPAVELPMEPNASTPWHVLETPSTDDGPDAPSGSPARQAATGGDLRPLLPRLLVIGALAIGCAIGAFLLATGSAGGAVRIDGGTRIDGATANAPVVSDGGAGVVPGGDLVVEIVGAVRRPGVYRLPQGSRTGDLVTAAGGYGPRVDTAAAEQVLNLAAAVHDGDKIRVPSRDDTRSAGPNSATDGAAARSGVLVDLNNATQAALEALPGVGPATAQKIIAAREEAPFAAVEELRSRGILGEKTFEKLRDLVSVG
jgi:competence protein ComEA